MDSLQRLSLDWNDPDILCKIVMQIKNPLQRIIDDSKKCPDLHLKNISAITKEIEAIIEQLLLDIRSKSITIVHHSTPDIFFIYEENSYVRSMCTAAINPKKITINDQNWLVTLEKEIYRSCSKNDLNISDLSDKMAVSERQLYRKITNLLHLTPNKYIRILKLHRAKQIIDQNLHHSISQIAYAVGYSDVYYFSKLFTAQYNVSPGQLIAAKK